MQQTEENTFELVPSASETRASKGFNSGFDLDSSQGLDHGSNLGSNLNSNPNSDPGFKNNKDFSYFLEKLVDKFQPLYVFCFAKHVESSEKISCFAVASHSYSCDYHLLMVSEKSTRIEHTVQDFANAHYDEGKITILVHGKESIDKAIGSNNRFFITVYKTAEPLYSWNSVPPLVHDADFDVVAADTRTRKFFEHRISLAQGFIDCAMECMAKGQHNLCVFNLHQVVEQCCIALIGVHMDYRCDIHNLRRLITLCRCFSDEPYQLFFPSEPDDERLFAVLVGSYVKVRYTEDFYIDTEDLNKLSGHCISLMKIISVGTQPY